jgi:hypothetical protein
MRSDLGDKIRLHLRLANVFLKIRQSENDVTLFDDITTYDYGKFVHLMDPDGNKIELWEP